MVSLRPMTDADYEPYLRNLLEGYARERADNFGTPLEEERVIGERQTAQLLPDGPRTPNHFLWTVVGDDDAPIGVLWVHVQPDTRQAFIYDIEMREDQRGKGYGKATLDALEAELRPRGITRIALNVFAKNAAARRLYEHAGYYPVATSMQKDLE